MGGWPGTFGSDESSASHTWLAFLFNAAKHTLPSGSEKRHLKRVAEYVENRAVQNREKWV